jgi:hypothetical protein
MNHPYRQILEDSISQHKELLKLQNEVVFFLDRKRNKDEKYRCLEDVQEDILTIETKNKIQTLEKIIFEKQKYFDAYMKQIVLDEKEMNENFDKYLSYAKGIAPTNDVVDKVLKNMNFTIAETNLQVKLELYKQLKNIYEIKQQMKAI